MKRIACLLAVVSFCILSYEVTLIRIIALTQWYHFAYMIISIALLGFGLSGIVISSFRQFFISKFYASVIIGTVLCSLSMVLSIPLMNLFSFDAYFIVFNPAELWKLVILYLIFLFPFLSGAFVIGLALSFKPQVTNRLYFANLIGSAAGGVSALVFLYLFRLNIIPGLIGIFCLISFLFIEKNKAKYYKSLFFPVIILILVAGIIKPSPLHFSEYKSLSKAMLNPEFEILYEKHGPLGLYTVGKSPVLRYAPGHSFSFKGRIDPQLGLFHDGEWIGTLSKLSDTLFIENMRKTTFSLPYQICRGGRALILASGTGQEVRFAVEQGFRAINAVEYSGELIRLLNEIEGYNVYDLPEVKLFTEDARTFVESEKEKYDLIVIPQTGGFTSSAAGIYSLYEDYLITIESFNRIVKCLTPDGCFCASTWMDYPHRRSVKLLSTLLKALSLSGFESPGSHLLVIRSWGTVTVVVKKSVLTQDEINRSKLFVDTNGFDWIHYPGIKKEETNRYHYLNEPSLNTAFNELTSERREIFLKNYLFNIKPATDEKPYFSNFVKISRLEELREMYRSAAVPFFEWGYIILIATLIQSVLLGAPIIIAPIVQLCRKNVEREKLLKIIAYFVFLGLGFMFIEILLIQRFILILGKPVYSVSIIISSLLFFAGLGSLISKRIYKAGIRIKVSFFMGIVVLTVLTYMETVHFLPVIAGYPLFLRMVISVVLIAPLAFLMGIPFPWGILKISEDYPYSVPSAWGVNGFASVIGTVLATYLAINLGFSLVLIISACIYISSMIVYLSFKGG